jgi:hypothetical protein
MMFFVIAIAPEMQAHITHNEVRTEIVPRSTVDQGPTSFARLDMLVPATMRAASCTRSKLDG